MAKFFILENREKLQWLLGEGYSLQIIYNKLGISKTALYTELAKGLTEEEYVNKQYIKYNAAKAIENEIVKLMGEDSLRKLKEYYDAI